MWGSTADRRPAVFTMIGNAPLPIRPRPLHGEAIMGYLMRVAAANGFSSARQLLGTSVATDGTAFQQVCGRLLLTPAERQSFTGVLPRQWGMGSPPLGLSPADFNHTCRRWCPACLKRVGPLAWRLVLQAVLRLHFAFGLVA